VSDLQPAVSAAELTARRRSGEISAAEHLALTQQLRDSDYWRTWAMRALLVLGAVHFLAGVVFFFAYNWDDLSSFAKFAVLQTAIVVSFIAALLLKLNSLPGQAMLIVASVFTGVLFAVIGQTYQTGADAWELFAAWTVLIFLWVLASKSLAHWFLWIVICLTAITLYGQQVPVALGKMTAIELATIVGTLPVIFLTIREFALAKGVTWLEGQWFRRSLVVLSMATLFTLAVMFVLFDADETAIGMLAYLVIAAAMVFVYRLQLPDFSILAIVIGFSSLLAMVIGGRIIFEGIFSSGDAGSLVLGLLLLVGWCVGVTTGVVRLLKHLRPTSETGAVDE